MAFKEVSSLDADVTVAIGGVNRKTGKKNPTSVEGYYLGSRKVESKKAKDGFAQIHFLQTAKGNIGVWGKTDLDRKIVGVTVGAMIRISHTGMQATPNGEMYKFKVEVDTDNSIEILSAGEQNFDFEESSEETPDDGFGFEQTEDYGQEPEGYGQVEAPRVSSAVQQDRKARVEALLNKNKKA